MLTPAGIQQKSRLTHRFLKVTLGYCNQVEEKLGLPGSKVWRLKWEPGDCLVGLGSGLAARKSDGNGR